MHNRLVHSLPLKIYMLCPFLLWGIFLCPCIISIALDGFSVFIVVVMVWCSAMTVIGIVRAFSGYKFTDSGILYRKWIKTRKINYRDIKAVVIAAQYSSGAPALCKFTHKRGKADKAYLIHTMVGIFTDDITTGRLTATSLWGRNVETLPEDFRYSFEFSPYVYENIRRLEYSKIYIPRETYDELSKFYDLSDVKNLTIIDDDQ